MSTGPITRIRDTVYVVGAGFSAGLEYPMTKSLLSGVWARLGAKERIQLRKIVKFHHPDFDPLAPSTFPDMERFLTEIDVNLKLFRSSRPAEGKFTKEKLKFLDHLVFNGEIVKSNYGLSPRLAKGPLLFKPHGSLNWYKGTEIDAVAESKRIEIFHHKDEEKCVHAFVHPRLIKSKTGNRYAPLIIPPTFLKDFKPSIFRQLWKNTTDVLSIPKKLYFLGYSLPQSDLHAQFIFRCGFYNQIHGRLREDVTRHSATGAAEVIVVNPDKAAFTRIKEVAGPDIHCTWIEKRLEDWVV